MPKLRLCQSNNNGKNNLRKSETIIDRGKNTVIDTLYILYTYLPYIIINPYYIDLYHLETTWFRARVIIFGSTSYIFIIGFERLCCTRVEYSWVGHKITHCTHIIYVCVVFHCRVRNNILHNVSFLSGGYFASQVIQKIIISHRYS